MLRNTALLFQFALIFIGFALVSWFAEPHIPEDGWWIALKLMALLGKMAGLGMGGLFLLMGLLQYTGFHHGKKARAAAIKQYLFFGGYGLIAAALLTVIITMSVNGNRTIVFVAILGIGPVGLLSVVASFFFSGADSRSDPADEKPPEKDSK